MNETVIMASEGTDTQTWMSDVGNHNSK
jgi:hypothetical protein